MDRDPWGPPPVRRWVLVPPPELFSRPILLIFDFLESRESDSSDLLFFRSFRSKHVWFRTRFVKKRRICSSFASLIGELGGGLSDLG